ncbi:MAG: response regulator [Deltaproteobacteria bacterium]|nr:response regulator [Deltaproteobacteria bacterium]
MKEKHNRKVLIVDDCIELVELFSSVLKRQKYEVSAATRGEEAVDVAQKERPSLIILDVDLPDIDGRAVAARLAEDDDTSGIPIVFLTGLIRKSEESLSSARLKHTTLSKPITVDELLRVVDSYFI